MENTEGTDDGTIRKTTERDGMDGDSHRIHGNGREQAGMSRESRRTMEKVQENTVHDTVLSFQPSTLGSDPTSVSSDLVLTCFLYCLAITPISPTPSHPNLLLYSAFYCLMLCSDLIVLLRINYDKL